jgi:hypothetical protein
MMIKYHLFGTLGWPGVSTITAPVLFCCAAPVFWLLISAARSGTSSGGRKTGRLHGRRCSRRHCSRRRCSRRRCRRRHCSRSRHHVKVLKQKNKFITPRRKVWVKSRQLGLGMEFCTGKKRLRTVSVIPRKKALIQYTKKLIEKKISCVLLFEGNLTSFFKNKMSKRSQKTLEIKVFLTVFA